MPPKKPFDIRKTTWYQERINTHIDKTGIEALALEHKTNIDPPILEGHNEPNIGNQVGKVFRYDGSTYDNKPIPKKQRTINYTYLGIALLTAFILTR